MTIPAHLFQVIAAHRRAGRRAGLVVRHAERHPVLDLRTHEDVLLTDNGHAQALAAGKLLAGLARHVRLHHSPVERCAQTARGLVAGAREAGAHAEVVGPLPLLASPFIRDAARAWELVGKMGPRFIREWFDGRLPPDVFEPRTSAAHTQVDVVRGVLEETESDVLNICVSHDWNIALVREEVLGVRPEQRWPGFLDGIGVAIDEDQVIVELEGTSGRLRRRTP